MVKRFRNLFGNPSFLLVLLIATAVIGVLWVVRITITAQDRLFVSNSQDMVNSALLQRQEKLVGVLREYSVWNDMAERVNQKDVDLEWLNTNLSGSLYSNQHINIEAIVDINQSINYVLIDGKVITPASGLPGVNYLISQLFPIARYLNPHQLGASPLGYYRVHEGDADAWYLAVLEPIVQETAISAISNPRYLLFAIKLDQQWIGSLAQSLHLLTPKIETKAPELLPSVALKGVNGAIEGYLVWSLNMPGETTYKTILPYVMCFLLVLAGFALLLGRLATLLQASQLNQAIRLAEQGDALRSLALSKDAIPSSEAYASEAAHLAHVTLHLPHVSVWELSDDGKILVCKAKVEQPKGISVFGHSIERNHAPWLFDVLDSKKSLVLNQVKDLSSEFESINLGRAGSILAMPTLVRDQVVGLVLGMGQWTRTWRPDEVNFFASISDMLALSLEAQARRRMELDLTQRSFFDHLTGLPNRVYIVQQLHNILSKKDAAVDYACVLIRVEGLVVVNDKFGFETGDQLMVGVAKRLAHFCGPNELVGRIGDNRFALFLDMQRGMNLTQRMDMLFGFFSSPVKAGNVALLAHLNAGACGLKHLDQLDEVMHNTEIALQSLHKSGRENTWLEYSLEHRKTALEVQVLSNELQQALEQDELFVLYQPITDLKTGRVCGAEALLRWRHPKRGLIGPLVFIPLAETTGSIYYIGLWVLRQAVRQIKEWQQLTSDLLTVSVNVSMLQLEYMNFAEDVTQILQEENINPSALELEVTEGIALSSAPEVEGNIAQLRAMKVALAIDDFGTGYASFSYLRRFEVGKIKIDRIFLDEVPDKKRNANLVKMIIAMGHTLNAKVTGEGIENIAQAEFLKEAGCDFGQGYHYAKPLEAGAFIRLLTSQAQPKS